MRGSNENNQQTTVYKDAERVALTVQVANEGERAHVAMRLGLREDSYTVTVHNSNDESRGCELSRASSGRHPSDPSTTPCEKVWCQIHVADIDGFLASAEREPGCRGGGRQSTLGSSPLV